VLNAGMGSFQLDCFGLMIIQWQGGKALLSKQKDLKDGF
jgi:hypothetical protein